MSIARSLLPCLALALVVAGPVAHAQDDGAHAPAKRAAIYDESADAVAQVDAAIAKAKKENTRVLIQWGANWCGWCHLLHATMAKDDDLKHELLYEYEVVLVDIGNGEKNAALAKRLGADYATHGVPYLTVVDGDGHVLANQDTGSLELKDAKEPGHDVAKVLAFLKSHDATPRAASAILEAGLAKAKAEQKVAFVHFGAPWCGWCHRLEAWLAQPEVAKIMGRAFVDVKIDVDRTVGGKDVLATYAGPSSGGIPWFVFLDGDGARLGDGNIMEGKNVGCPWSEAEVAAFRTLLAKVSRTLKPAEIDAATARLGEKANAGADAGR